MLMNIIYTLIIFVATMILLYLLYQNQLIEKRQIIAYIIEMKNKNENILVQTKVKIINKEKIHNIKAKINDEEVDVIANGNCKNTKNIRYIYWDKNNNKYYLERNSETNIKCKAKVSNEEIYYKYKLKDRAYTFDKISKNLLMNPEQIIFRNPFTAEYFWDYESKEKEKITEMDLVNKIPKKLDVYFFDNKEMKKILESKNANVDTMFGLFSIIAGFVALISFIFFIIF